MGKSTLFNNLIGTYRAIVSDIEGTTRDILYHPAKIEDKEFVFLDTPGLEPEAYDEVIDKIVDEADWLLFVVDGQQ